MVGAHDNLKTRQERSCGISKSCYPQHQHPITGIDLTPMLTCLGRQWRTFQVLGFLHPHEKPESSWFQLQISLTPAIVASWGANQRTENLCVSPS